MCLSSIDDTTPEGVKLVGEAEKLTFFVHLFDQTFSLYVSFDILFLIMFGLRMRFPVMFHFSSFVDLH